MGLQAPQRRASWHDAHDARLDLTDWYRTPYGAEWLREHYRINTDGYNQSSREMLAQLTKTEPTKLIDADPVFVSAEMCELVEFSSQTFEPEPVMPSDLLTAHAFLLWETPFLRHDRDNQVVSIGAMSWSPIIGSRDRAEEAPARDEMLRWFQERDYGRLWAEAEAARERGEEPSAGFVDGVAITLYATNRRDGEWNEAGPVVLPMHMTPWWFGMSFDGNEFDEGGRLTAAGQWWKIAQTTLRLMQQRIADPWRERPQRPSRRRAQRQGFEDRDVVVVRLRRPKGPPTDAPAGKANYSHRFIVSGHWRQQWYPSEHAHRQIWISPYQKGDESLPLIWRPNRVYNWGR